VLLEREGVQDPYSITVMFCHCHIKSIRDG